MNDVVKLNTKATGLSEAVHRDRSINAAFCSISSVIGGIAKCDVRDNDAKPICNLQFLYLV